MNDSKPEVRRHFAALHLAVAAAACVYDAPLPSTYMVRDSVGVRIVESEEPAWGPDEGWTIGPEPALHIGVMEGAEEYQFTVIGGRGQYGGTWQQSDGTIVAADAGTRQIRKYDSAGSFLNGWGRRGEGPGEFRRLTIFPYPGDSIVAFDIARYTFYDSAGNLGRILALDLREMDPTGELPMPVASTGFMRAFDDGSFLAMRFPTPIRYPGQCQSPEHIVLRFTATGELTDTIGVYTAPTNCTPPEGSPLISLPFVPEFVFAGSGESVYVGSESGFEIHQTTLPSRDQTVIRASHVDLRATEAHRDGYRDFQRGLAQVNNRDLPSIERALLEVEFPEVVPAFSQLLVDSGNHLWVRHFKQRWADGPETWSIFAPEGYLLGTVETPARLQVRQIEIDFILGIWTDEFDVRYVRKYDLVGRVTRGID